MRKSASLALGMGAPVQMHAFEVNSALFQASIVWFQVNIACTVSALFNITLKVLNQRCMVALN